MRYLIVGAVALLAAVIVWSWQAPSVGLRVDAIGEPQVVAISATPGSCSEPASAVGSDGRKFVLAECGSSATRVRITARCSNAALPVAYVEQEFEKGTTSNYVQFNDVCSSSAEQIASANAKSAGTTIWKREQK